MQSIPDKSIDMILADLPYGTTRNKWDVIIPFAPMWAQYERIIKDNGAIVLMASQPFTSLLVTSNLKLFRYDLTWDKKQITGFFNAKKMQLRQHEDVVVFYKKPPVYNPQFSAGKPYTIKRDHQSSNYGKQKKNETKSDGKRYPTSIIRIPQVRVKGGEPTQKPVALFENLIKTYTNEGDLVLDNCAGRMTTAVASINTKRRYICIEKDPVIFCKGKERVKNHLLQLIESLK